MGLRELQSFVTLAELGTITATAGKLNLTAAAIHKQLKVLEAELGVRLYGKSGRQLFLTPAAETILPHVRKVLAEYEATFQVVQELKGVKRGLVRIGSGPTMSSYLLPSLIETFRRGHPDVELFIQTGSTKQLLRRLGAGEVDAAFVVLTDPLHIGDLRVETVWSFEIIIVSAEAPACGLSCRVAELRDLPFILYEEGSVFEEIIDGYFRQNNLQPRAVMRFDNAEAIKAMARTGLGFSMLPAWTVTEELKVKSLVHVRQREKPLRARIALLVRRLSYVPPAVRVFVETAKRWQWKDVRIERLRSPRAAT